ncbi:hypothetical protein GII36_00675 [Candidatus Mycosynbacter amalyticus]|uniref:WxL domain-containing protein n=1 Tax=Candidatus Mycosynbacter amalyticus TaxID=2665156 RepID=A0A857MIJ0_9BACT|nr:hypothetical protein [Candidatus Mycosynbacter amalyticus]QHN42373.1 hypothetical protein GII36_00675 [Candidatus Mycosynbacter amalyticus]
MSKRVVRLLGVSILSGLLVAAAPIVASAASQTASTTVNATVGSVISMSTSTTVAISLTPTSGGVVSSASDTVSVSTNNALGYNLTLADSDATTNLVNGGNTIGAHTGTQASPSALASNTWGYRVVNVGGFGASAYTAETNNGSSTSTWAGVPATGSANTLKSTSSTASGDTTTVWYGVKVNSTKANGTYTDTVTYTATTN